MLNPVPEPLRTTEGTHRYIGPHLEVGWMPATRHNDGVVGRSGDVVLTPDDYRALRSIQRLSSPPSKDSKLGRFIDSDVLGRRAALAGPDALTAYNAIDVLHYLVQEYFLPSIAGLEDDTLRSELQAALESKSGSPDNLDYSLRIDSEVVDRCVSKIDWMDEFPGLRDLSPTFRVRHGETLAETDHPRAYIAKVRAAVGELLDARFPGQVVAADEEEVLMRLERAALISVPASAGTQSPRLLHDQVAP